MRGTHSSSAARPLCCGFRSDTFRRRRRRVFLSSGGQNTVFIATCRNRASLMIDCIPQSCRTGHARTRRNKWRTALSLSHYSQSPFLIPTLVVRPRFATARYSALPRHHLRSVHPLFSISLDTSCFYIYRIEHLTSFSRDGIRKHGSGR